jgi:hypothetical protein
MNRTEFIRRYAEQSKLSAKTASLGFIELGQNRYRLALPCGCDSELCDGWAMIVPDMVDHHLRFYAPDALRDAYNAAVGQLCHGTQTLNRNDA